MAPRLTLDWSPSSWNQNSLLRPSPDAKPLSRPSLEALSITITLARSNFILTRPKVFFYPIMMIEIESHLICTFRNFTMLGLGHFKASVLSPRPSLVSTRPFFKMPRLNLYSCLLIASPSKSGLIWARWLALISYPKSGVLHRRSTCTLHRRSTWSHAKTKFGPADLKPKTSLNYEITPDKF